jgi:hypothetical protein
MINFYRVRAPPAVALVAIDDRETTVKSLREVERITFKIAYAEIIAKKGGHGRCHVEPLTPLFKAVPANALTHPDCPGVSVWFV